jgi:hypothetical protein
LKKSEDQLNFEKNVADKEQQWLDEVSGKNARQLASDIETVEAQTQRIWIQLEKK